MADTMKGHDMANFHSFAVAVKDQFDRMAATGALYEVDVSTDDLWAKYLDSFPEGTNPIFRERTEHDCSCCQNFVKNVGNVVAVDDVSMELVTVWDKFESFEYPYREVARSMRELVLSANISNHFFTKEKRYGAESSVELLDDGQTRRWNHFYAHIPSNFVVYEGADTKIGQMRSDRDVFVRGLEEFRKEDLDTVISLIEQNALYRGQESLQPLKAFRNSLTVYRNLDPAKRDAFGWRRSRAEGSRIRNTAIGTLLQDLSSGVELERAVRSYEQKVAPANYKRPTALVTPRMVQSAMKTIEELGLESSTHRRFANLSDVAVNNVLWVNGHSRKRMRGGLEGLLMDHLATVPQKVEYDAESISIDEFMKDIVPRTKHMSVCVRNTQLNNFVSLTAPVDPEAPRLFKWDNNFAWSYEGNVTDSIKARVKKAGGNVEADLRISLSWSNYDDLDLHIEAPKYGHIYFTNKCGILDVDMNAGGSQSREPVENMAFMKPVDGSYKVVVNNYRRRESIDVGFTIEVENDGKISQFTCARSPADGQSMIVGAVRVRNGKIVEMDMHPNMVEQGMSRQYWGVGTETYSPVSTIMLSPNFWDDNRVGNKHWFFMLEGCKNPEPTRGIYNEFLKSELDVHRKVFELIGEKTKCPVVDDQLSGVGFSSTRNDEVVVYVEADRLHKAYRVKF